MAEGRDFARAYAAVAEVLESRRDAILDLYESYLREAGSSLVADAKVRNQCMLQASSILADLCTSLRNSRRSFDAATMVLTRDIGISRAASSTHPSESLLAADTLYEVVLSEIRDCVTGSPDAATILYTAALALQSSIMWRIKEASGSYAGFLLNKVHEAHLVERRRIARELHDRIGYGISAANRGLELYQVYLDKDPARAEEKVAIAQEALREALSNIRQVVTDLRLQARTESLEKALRRYVEANSNADTTVDLVINGDETWVPPDILDEAFLVIREALRNAFAHSRASRVITLVDIAPHEMRAVVEDNGIGVDVAQQRSTGAGLASMSERVGLLGGALLFSSLPGQGTSVKITLPLTGAGDGQDT